MRKLYKEFFHIPEFGKICEKVMLTRVVTTVTVIIVCLAAMGITAYAYFSHDIASETNKIQAANFETNVNIRITDQNGEAVKVITSNYKSHQAELKAGTTYYITLKPTERSTAKTGFVIITAEKCDKTYHTQQLGKDGEAITQSISFCLVPGADTKVTFLAHWGTSSYYGYGNNAEQYILQGETVLVPVNGVVSTDKSDKNNGTDAKDTHTVADKENLTKIASLYGTTPERIAAYNDITNENLIRAGMILKIPPADWEMPANTTPPATETPVPEETTPPATETPAPEETTPPATETPVPEETTPPATTTNPPETTTKSETQSEVETSETPATEANG